MTTWTTRTGAVIKISEMTNEHLQNSIRMLENIIASYPGYQVYTGSGEMAEQAVEQENRRNEELLDRRKLKLRELEKELLGRV